MSKKINYIGKLKDIQEDVNDILKFRLSYLVTSKEDYQSVYENTAIFTLTKTGLKITDINYIFTKKQAKKLFKRFKSDCLSDQKTTTTQHSSNNSLVDKEASIKESIRAKYKLDKDVFDGIMSLVGQKTYVDIAKIYEDSVTPITDRKIGAMIREYNKQLRISNGVILKTFKLDKGNSVIIELYSPELTYLGQSGQPYKGRIWVQYVAENKAVDTISFKKYLSSLIKKQILSEDLINLVYNDFRDVLESNKVKVTIDLTARGGIQNRMIRSGSKDSNIFNPVTIKNTINQM